MVFSHDHESESSAPDDWLTPCRSARKVMHGQSCVRSREWFNREWLRVPLRGTKNTKLVYAKDQGYDVILKFHNRQ